MRWGEENINKWHGESRAAMCKTEFSPSLTPGTKANSKWMDDLEIRTESANDTEESESRSHESRQRRLQGTNTAHQADGREKQVGPRQIKTFPYHKGNDGQKEKTPTAGGED